MKRYLFPMAAGIMAIASCTSEEVIDVSPTQSNVIGFDNVVNKHTRAVDGDLTTGKFDNFLVYGYYTKANMSTPIQIFDGISVSKQKNSSTGLDEWRYDGVRYWIPTCKYYFYAYSCADIALTSGKGNPVMALTTNNDKDSRALTISSYLCDETHQHDLVCAENEEIEAKEENNPQVALKFSHVLCKIKAVFTTDFPDDYKVKVSNVRISDFFNIADYNVGTGIWSQFKIQNAQDIVLHVDEKNNTITNAPDSKVETSEAFLIPKKYANTESAKIHFTVELSKDGNVIFQRNIAGTWSPQWEKSCVYKYNINITGTSAGIEPIVFAASQELGGNSTWDNSSSIDMSFGVDTPPNSVSE